MEITRKTKIAAILKEYGDIAEVMETFGIKSVGKYSFRKFLTRFISVEMAAKIHKVPVPTMLILLNRATKSKQNIT